MLHALLTAVVIGTSIHLSTQEKLESCTDTSCTDTSCSDDASLSETNLLQQKLEVQTDQMPATFPGGTAGSWLDFLPRAAPGAIPEAGNVHEFLQNPFQVLPSPAPSPRVRHMDEPSGVQLTEGLATRKFKGKAVPSVPSLPNFDPNIVSAAMKGMMKGVQDVISDSPEEPTLQDVPLNDVGAAMMPVWAGMVSTAVQTGKALAEGGAQLAQQAMSQTASMHQTQWPAFNAQPQATFGLFQNQPARHPEGSSTNLLESDAQLGSTSLARLNQSDMHMDYQMQKGGSLAQMDQVRVMTRQQIDKFHTGIRSKIRRAAQEHFGRDPSDDHADEGEEEGEAESTAASPGHGKNSSLNKIFLKNLKVCTVGGQKCVFPFTYRQKTYNECTKNHQKKAWCATKVDSIGHVGDSKADWDHCADSCPQTCKTKQSATCIFPFKYDGNTYHECALHGRPQPWCATSVEEDGMMSTEQWGYCDMNTCGTEVQEGSERCSWCVDTYKFFTGMLFTWICHEHKKMSDMHDPCKGCMADFVSECERATVYHTETMTDYPKGSFELAVQSAKGFKVGDTIDICSKNGCEKNRIKGFASLILAVRTKLDHPKGASIKKHVDVPFNPGFWFGHKKKAGALGKQCEWQTHEEPGMGESECEGKCLNKADCMALGCCLFDADNGMCWATPAAAKNVCADYAKLASAPAGQRNQEICPRPFPMCDANNNCVIKRCVFGCRSWEKNANFLEGYDNNGNNCQADYRAHCPKAFPHCEVGGNCVLRSCRNGCTEFVEFKNYINGYDGTGRRCNGDYQATCPKSFPVCDTSANCVITLCANGCHTYTRNQNFIEGYDDRNTDCNADYPATCPREFPVCDAKHNCVTAACADGCLTLIRNTNYISGYDDQGHPCTKHYQGQCPVDFPICNADNNCIKRECAQGCAEYLPGVNYMKGFDNKGSKCQHDADVWPDELERNYGKNPQDGVENHRAIHNLTAAQCMDTINRPQGKENCYIKYAAHMADSTCNTYCEFWLAAGALYTSSQTPVAAWHLQAASPFPPGVLPSLNLTMNYGVPPGGPIPLFVGYVSSSIRRCLGLLNTLFGPNSCQVKYAELTTSNVCNLYCTFYPNSDTSHPVNTSMQAAWFVPDALTFHYG